MMKKAMTTKRALLSSVLALALCMSMFVGTTFAWFTDSVTSAGNVITAGNLDIKVEYTLDGENWADLDGADDLFQKGLWEPGHTEVIALKVTNAGTLALKYNAIMNILSENIGKTKDGKDIKLSEILTVSTLNQQVNQAGEIALALAFDGENRVAYENTAPFAKAGILEADQELHPGVAHYLIVKVDMAETVGNEANHDGVNVPSIEFGIDVLATQYTYESDSFGSNYDADAQYSKVYVNTVADLDAAAKNGGNVILMGDVVADKGDSSSIASCSALVVTKDTVLSGNGSIKNSGYVVSVYDANAKLTVNGGSYVGSCTAVYARKGNVVINGGFFRDTNADDNGHYLLNCYDSAYKSGEASITVTGGTFVNFDPANNTAEGANTNFVADGYKSVKKTQANGEVWYYVVAEDTLVPANKDALKAGLEAAVAEGKTDIKVDFTGSTVNMNNGVTKATVPAGTTVTIANAVVEGRSYGNAVDGTVIFENCTFTNTGAYSIHFDAGNGHVVFKNCTLEGWCSFGGAISSVTMENCTLRGNGIYAMYRFYQDTTITNCTIDCENAVGTDGFADGVSAVNGSTLTLNGCNIIDADYEADESKIIVDGVTVLDATGTYTVIKNEDR